MSDTSFFDDCSGTPQCQITVREVECECNSFPADRFPSAAVVIDDIIWTECRHCPGIDNSAILTHQSVWFKYTIHQDVFVFEIVKFGECLQVIFRTNDGDVADFIAVSQCSSNLEMDLGHRALSRVGV